MQIIGRNGKIGASFFSRGMEAQSQRADWLINNSGYQAKFDKEGSHRIILENVPRDRTLKLDRNYSVTIHIEVPAGQEIYFIVK